MGQKKIMKAKRLTTAMRLCTGNLESVADKLQYARLTAGIHQDVLADMIGIDRITLLRYENGHRNEDSLCVEWLIRIAIACGLDKYFCCNDYHIFLAENPGQQIKQWRKSQKLTQKKLAAMLGVNITTLKRWEYNENKPPRYIWELVAGTRSIDV